MKLEVGVRCVVEFELFCVSVFQVIFCVVYDLRDDDLIRRVWDSDSAYVYFVFICFVLVRTVCFVLVLFGVLDLVFVESADISVGVRDLRIFFIDVCRRFCVGVRIALVRFRGQFFCVRYLIVVCGVFV